MIEKQLIFICLSLLGYMGLFRYIKKEENGPLKLTDSVHLFIGGISLIMGAIMLSILVDGIMDSLKPAPKNEDSEQKVEQVAPPDDLKPKINSENNKADDFVVTHYRASSSEEIKLEFTSKEIRCLYKGSQKNWIPLKVLNYQGNSELPFKVRFADGQTYEIRTQGKQLYSRGPLPQNQTQIFTEIN